VVLSKIRKGTTVMALCQNISSQMLRDFNFGECIADCVAMLIGGLVYFCVSYNILLTFGPDHIQTIRSNGMGQISKAFSSTLRSEPSPWR